MVELATLQAVSYIMGSLGVFVAAVYYVLNIQNNRRNQQQQLETRQAQLFMQIYSRFDDPDWMRNWAEVVRQWEWTDYDDWHSKYSPEENIEASVMYGSIAAYFEGIGVLVYRKLIDVEQVADLMARNITIFWEKMGPIIKERRVRYNNEYVWEWNEWLYKEIKKHQINRKPAYLLN